MAAALGWGALAASSLVIGALLAYARRWPERQVGLVLAFGAGALISAISFELASEGIEVGSIRSTALGLGLGALAFFFLDGTIDAHFAKGGGRRGRAQADDPGIALALGAFLDGIPEQLVLGIGLAGGQGVGLGLLVAIFVSNLPEAIGSATAMDDAGEPRRRVIRPLARGRRRLHPRHGPRLRARRHHLGRPSRRDRRLRRRRPPGDADRLDDPRRDPPVGPVAGLVTTLGFAVATALSSLD